MNDSDQIEAFQSEIKIRFKNPELLRSAITHPSAHEGRNEKAHREFERMEFFGDTLLSFIITGKLLETYPDLDEGNLSKFRSTLVSREALFNVIASKINLHKYASVGPGEDVKSPRDKAKILADITEAILAAIYYDQGLEAVRQFVLSHFNAHMTRENIHEISFNAKGALQEEVQKRTQQLPDYQFERRGNVFVCTVSGGAELGSATGEGQSKKEAAQVAAAALLKKLNPLGEAVQETPATSVIQPNPTPQAHVERKVVTHHPRRPPFRRGSQDHRRPFRPRRPYRPSTSTTPLSSTSPSTSATPSTPTHSHTPRHHSPHPRKHREAGSDLDWRAWQSSQEPKLGKDSGEDSGKEKPKSKSNWREHIKKLTGKIRPKKSS